MIIDIILDRKGGLNYTVDEQIYILDEAKHFGFEDIVSAFDREDNAALQQALCEYAKEYVQGIKHVHLCRFIKSRNWVGESKPVSTPRPKTSNKPKTEHQYYYRIVRHNGSVLNATARAHTNCNSPFFSDRLKGDAIRYAPTKLEARKHLNWCREEFAPAHSGETTVTRCGLVGIASTLDEDTRKQLEVVGWELRHRVVTTWEIIQ